MAMAIFQYSHSLDHLSKNDPARGKPPADYVGVAHFSDFWPFGFLKLLPQA
jgi:hypothetical protein